MNIESVPSLFGFHIQEISSFFVLNISAEEITLSLECSGDHIEFGVFRIFPEMWAVEVFSGGSLRRS